MSKQMTAGNGVWGGRQLQAQQDYPNDPRPQNPAPQDLPNNPPRPVPGQPVTTTNPVGQPASNPGEQPPSE